ncbi:MAG: acyl-CoA thioesterase [Pirellulaceae bacterium]
MPAVFELEHAVQDDEIDSLGHVNNLAYLRWMIRAAVAHATERGWPTQRHLELGCGWIVRSHTIKYLSPAFAGERVLIYTWVSNFKKITSLRKYKITRPADASVLAVAQTKWAFVDYQRNQPRRVPREIMDSFEVVPEEQEP